MTVKKENKIYQKQAEDIRRLFLHGLEAVAPEKIIRDNVIPDDDILSVCGRSYALPEDRRIWVFGSGKAAGRMALELERVLGKWIYDGIVICPYGLKTDTERIQQFEASHPVPDLNSLTATFELMEVASDVRETDLVIYLMSGGSSSLLCMPHDDLEMEDIRGLYRELLRCGAPIREINRIRKSVSKVKGGKLRPCFGEAMVEVLAISDVPGNDPADIGSGPLVDDPVGPEEALELLRKYDIDKRVPRAVLRLLLKPEAPKANAAAGTGFFSQKPAGRSDDGRTDAGETSAQKYPTHFNVLASAEKVAEEIKKGAISLGYHAHVHEGFMTGEARKVAKTISGEAVDVLVRNRPVEKPAALIYYGESTVTVKGNGKGGRNQEMALSAVMALEGQHHITFLSGGTDGRDGETNAAGAVCNAQTGLDARKLGVDPEPYLENNDSWNFFRKTDGLLQIGVTGNNLMDIQIVLIEK
ncbi:DUF4147 domain-containing protein [Balneolales bacterium ANBcel1]|nr:DUF4147 domain-containing protein [Balneolales bacterium ANBcel1]